MIRTVKKEDAADICRIYNYYVSNSTITFEEEPIETHEMEGRIEEVTKILPWIVYEEDGELIGYAYASKWKGRCAYRYSVESTVYLHNNHTTKGVGTKLYKKLLDEVRERNFHLVIGGVALPNIKSEKLHEKLGFKKVAHFSEVGFKFNKWIDVGYWELKL